MAPNNNKNNVTTKLEINCDFELYIDLKNNFKDLFVSTNLIILNILTNLNNFNKTRSCTKNIMIVGKIASRSTIAIGLKIYFNFPFIP